MSDLAFFHQHAHELALYATVVLVTSLSSWLAERHFKERQTLEHRVLSLEKALNEERNRRPTRAAQTEPPAPRPPMEWRSETVTITRARPAPPPSLGEKPAKKPRMKRVSRFARLQGEGED